MPLAILPPVPYSQIRKLAHPAFTDPTPTHPFP
jgi:hypothetical protein